MKKSFAIRILMLGAILIAFRCQHPIPPIVEISEEGIVATDAVAKAIATVAAKDGSADNLIDRCSCTSVVFPVSGMYQDREVQFNQLVEVENLGAGVLEVEWLYPIQVVLPDYSRVSLASETALEAIQSTCLEGGNDPDNECIDFMYPITVQVYNQQTENVSSLELTQDEQMYHTFTNPDVIVTLPFPVQMLDAEANTIQAATEQDLIDVIASSNLTCDEEDETNLEEMFLNQLFTLVTSPSAWTISHYEINGNDRTGQYAGYTLEFATDYTMMVRGSETIIGYWDIELLDDGEALAFEFDTDTPAFTTLNGTWRIISEQENGLLLSILYEENSKVLELSYN